MPQIVSVQNRKLKNNSRTHHSISLTMSFVATEAKVARRRLLQFVHVITIAISNLDLNIPPTAIIAPVETDLSVDCALFLLGVFPLHPSRRMRTTALCGHAGIWHLSPSISNKLVPLSNCTQIPAVASKETSSQGSRSAISFAEFYIHDTFRRNYDVGDKFLAQLLCLWLFRRWIVSCPG